MKEITTLVFDLGNVITKAQDRSKVETMRSLLGEVVSPQDFAEAYTACRKEYDGGEIDYRRYWRRVAETLGVEVPESRLEALRDTDLKSWFNIEPDMVSFISELRKQTRHLVLLSNIHRDGADYLERSYAWKDLFERRIYSCDYRINKPDPEIFRIAVTAVGEKPEKCLLIDDLKENVEGGRRAGLNAVQFQNLAQLKRELVSDYAVTV